MGAVRPGEWTVIVKVLPSEESLISRVTPTFPLNLPVNSRVRSFTRNPCHRYTHRVAISNHRLVSFTDGQVTFRWRDSAHHHQQKLLTLSLDEFLQRFLLHILPKGFVRIRNFGFQANRRRSTLLPLCFQLLGTTPQPPAEEHSSSTEDAAELYRCPHCGGPMKVIERLTAAEILLRSPPEVTAAA